MENNNLKCKQVGIFNWNTTYPWLFHPYSELKKRQRVLFEPGILIYGERNFNTTI